MRLPTFYDDEGEDHEDYVCRMIGYINSLPALPNDANLSAILDHSIRGEARTWFDQKFNNINWQLDNIIDTGALVLSELLLEGFLVMQGICNTQMRYLPFH